MKKLVFFYFFQIISIVVFSQSSVWKIEGKGSKIYVGGTIHILREQDYPLPDEFYDAFNNSEILVTEMDMAAAKNPENVKKLMEIGMYNDGNTLKDVLSEEVFKELELYCGHQGISLEGMKMFKPSMLVILLTYHSLQKLGVSAEGVDVYLSNKAIENNKQQLFLETFEQQLEFITITDEGNEDEYIKYSLKDLEEADTLFEELIEGWKNGNSDLAIDQLTEFRQDFPELYKTILTERNNNWIPQLENHLETVDVEFVVFGALHLYGTEGVLQLMKDKGYKVEQL